MFKEYKDLVDDCSIQQVAMMANARCVGDHFLEKVHPFEYSGDETLRIREGVGIPMWNGERWLPLFNLADIEFDPKMNLDTGDALEYGKDYCVYLCIDGKTPEIVLSLNSTHPGGSTALTSRKIGGYHHGAIRRVNEQHIPLNGSGDAYGSGWEQQVFTGILENSVWDLENRPKTLMPGLAKVGNIWMGIYQCFPEEAFTFQNNANGLQVARGKLGIAYGKLPITGTEGMNQYTFSQAARRQGMRLPHYDEWLQGAIGSPQGLDDSNDNGWTKTSNTARTYTGCSVNTSNGAHDNASGVKPYAVSAYGLCDCVGNVWDWGADYSWRQPDATAEDPLGWKYRDQLGAEQGQIYCYGLNNLASLSFGGDWYDGVHAGARTVHLSHFPWHVGTNIGARLVCDAK